MPITIVIHILDEPPIVAEIDELPEPSNRLIVVNNPRRKDGKDLHYLDANVVTVMYPLERITFIEVMPSLEEERIIGFVRE